MRKSIQYYFFRSMAIVLISCVVLIGIIQTVLAVSNFRNEKESLLASVVKGVLDGSREGEIDISLNNSTLRYIAKVTDATIFVADQDGRLIFTTEAMGFIPLPDNQLSERICTQLVEQEGYRELGKLDGLLEYNHYVVGAAARDSEGNVTGFVFAITSAAGLTNYLIEIITSYLLSTAFVLLVGSIVALFLANNMVVPIRRISDAARRFGEGDYSARVPVEGDSELSQLAVTFNEMANSFEATDISRRSFMGNIAHELRTPMTSIKGFIDGMLDGTIPEDQRDKYLGVVSDEVGRLARLTQNMLDISRLEAGEYTSNPVVFNIWSPITSVLLSAEQRLEDKEVTIEGLSARATLYVLADEDFVHQVLFNLLDNAIKFVGQGGVITVTAKPSRNVATISIRNTGTGIASDVLPHIFDRFYKADKSRGINAAGSGLGLHICRVLVGLMGGRIWADSKEGEWTEFNFTLPCAPAKRVSALKAEAKNSTKGEEGPRSAGQENKTGKS